MLPLKDYNSYNIMFFHNIDARSKDNLLVKYSKLKIQRKLKQFKYLQMKYVFDRQRMVYFVFKLCLSQNIYTEAQKVLA